MSISEPNYTQTPNELFDKLLPLLSEAELKMFLVAVRKTFGWHKKRDRISLSQFEKLTGMARKSCIAGVKGLLDKDLLWEVKSRFGNEYEVKVVENIPQGSGKFTPDVVENLHIQKKQLNKGDNTSQDSDESFVDHCPQDISKTVNSSKAKKEKPNKNSAPEWIAARDRIRLLFMTNYKEWTKAKDGEEAPFPVGPKENTHIKALATRFQNHMPKFEKMLKAFYRVVMTKERGWEQAAFLPSFFVFAEGRIAALVSGLSNSDIMQERNGSSNKAGMKI